MSGYFIVFIMLACVSLGVALVVHLCNRSNKVENYSQKDPMLMELQSLLIKLHPKATTIDMTEAGKSYTVNKKHMHLCLRNEKKEYFNKNHLIYVAIHESQYTNCCRLPRSLSNGIIYYFSSSMLNFVLKNVIT
jgi:hypothetical protein